MEERSPYLEICWFGVETKGLGRRGVLETGQAWLSERVF